MCGIVGWVDHQNNISGNTKTMEKMRETLTARGPDDKNMWKSKHCILAHSRLIVIDPKGGKQPMSRTVNGKTYTITYNGELYNTADLRDDLLKKGYSFQTNNSDTETLLFSYIEWGENCLQYLNGIFAFAIWNHSKESIFLARDRLGVKPLFYTYRNGSLLFASEIKALLAHPEIKPLVDHEGLAEIFLMGPSRTPGNGVFENIKELKSGHFLNLHKRDISIKRYWQVKSEIHQDSLTETAEKIKGLLIDTVERQLISDVPVCTFLSGGLDSSALTAIAANYFSKNNTGRLHTYSVNYESNEQFFKSNSFQPDSDEPWIKLISETFNTTHHEIRLKIEELAHSLSAATRARDLPGMADIDSSLLLFCQAVKDKSTVALSGEAADEIFGGYPWFHQENLQGFPWIRNVEERLKLLSPQIRNTIKAKEYLNSRYSETLNDVPLTGEESETDRKMKEISYLNMIWFMSTLLDRKDRMSMAHGLEVRVPFCDHRLVEYAWNIPWQMKNWGESEKGILRMALYDILPKKVLERKKSPYPKTHNPKYIAMVSKKLLSILNDKSSPLNELVDKEALFKLLEDTTPKATDMPWFGQLMTQPQYYAYLIQVNTWLNEFNVNIK